MIRSLALLGMSLCVAPPAQAQWWESFGDAQLSQLVVEALEANPDVAAAQARVEQARGISVQVLSQVLPKASFDVGLNTGPFDSIGFQFGGLPTAPGVEPPDTYTTGSALLKGSWAPDLFGQGALGHQASLKDVEANRADRKGLALAVSGNVVRAWFDLGLLTDRLELVGQQVQLQADLLEITRGRYRASEKAGIEVLQQEQQLASTRALLPLLELQRDLAAQRLDILLGQEPDQQNPQTHLPLTLPPSPESSFAPPLLEAAELRYQGARLRRHQSVLKLAPSFRLNAQTGWNISWFGDYDSQSTWGIGASMSLPLFAGGGTWAGIHSARAQERAASYTLDSTRLQARQALSTGKLREAQQSAYLEAVVQQLAAARNSFDAAKERYRDGVADYLTLVNTLVALQQTELAELQARRDLLEARIALHEAMGGPLGVSR